MHSLKFNTFVNILKKIISLVFPLIIFPYVSSRLGVDAFGEYNYANAIVSYFALFASFGIGTYAVRECASKRNDLSKLNSIISQLFSINLIFTILSYVILYFILFRFEKLNLYKHTIIILSISIFFNTISVEWLNEVFEDYLYITFRYIVLQLINLFLIVLFIKNSDDLYKYCLITVAINMLLSLYNHYHFKDMVKISFMINNNFFFHIKPILIFFLSSIAVTIYVNSDMIMIGSMLDLHSVGIYAFAVKVYDVFKSALATLIATSVPRLTFLHSNDNELYHKYINKIYSVIILLIFPLIAGIYVLGRDIIYILGKVNYFESYNILLILSFSIIFAILGAFYSSFILIIKKEETVVLYATIFAALINIVLNYFYLPKYGIVAAAYTTLLAEFVNYFIKKIYCFKVYRTEFCFEKKVYLFSVIMAIIVINIGKILNYILYGNSITQSVFRCIIVFIISLLVYYLFLFLFNKNIINEILNIKSMFMFKKRSDE